MIADTFIKRPVTAMVISIVLVLVGLIAIFILPISQYPNITPPTVSVTATYTGADAQTVEQTTTTPMEVQINGSPGMTYMQSSSTGSGQSNITVYYDLGTNIDIATLDVQNRVSIATPTLPDYVKRIGVTVRKRSPDILIVLAVYSPNGTHNSEYIGNFTNIYLHDELIRVPGVGDVIVRGDQFSMRVWLDPNKLSTLGLTPADVSNAINEQNLQIAAGSLGANPQPATQAFEYTVLTNSRLNTVDQFKNIIVRTNPKDASIIRLSDVAKVELAKFDYTANSLVSGKPSAFCLIYLAPGANALETYNGVMTRLNELKKTFFPADLDYAIPRESATVITASIHEVVETFVVALILVVLVVFLFLQNVRATIIPLLAIPVSLIGTFIFFIPLGFTINTLTLFAFVLAIGIVVDDAIVVVEAVEHYMETEKIPPKEATRKAMSDISGPVIAIALILAAVFVPVSFIPGISGKLYQQFAITIAVSVLISAFVALSLTPALCTLLLKPKKEKESHDIFSRFFNAFNRWFGKLTTSYTHAVSVWIRRTPLVIGMMVVLVVALFFLFKAKPTEFIPNEDVGSFYVPYVLPEASSTTRSIDMLKQIMDSVQSVKGVNVAGGLAGFNVADNGSIKVNTGTMFVALKPFEERSGYAMSQDAILAQVQKKVMGIKGATVFAVAPPAINGLGTTAGFSFELQQRSSNDDIFKFEQIARKFIGELSKRKEIGTVRTFFNPHTPAYQMNINRDKAKQLNVSISDAYTVMSSFLGSSYVNDFNLYGRNFHVVTMADSADRASTDDVKKFYVRNQSGGMVPLSALVDSVQLIESPSIVSHYNVYRNIEITGSSATGYSSGQALQALKETAAKFLPAGYGYEFSGMSLQEEKAGSATMYIFAASIIFVFLFLAALYESWSIPFAVLFAVPIGLFGAILILSVVNLIFPATMIHVLTNNIYAQIGMITIIGLAAKNAILIVEFANEGVMQGMDVARATLHAVQIRFRPILMTSLAFILGVLPLAFASGAASVSRQTIGWTVLGGMIAATSLAIFVVPVWFVLITNIARGKHKKVKVDITD
ncbi:MAG: multidrug efflux RND transporter permease subunit [Arachidicoccus sp.]|nr:multidrug efflux RND transporter permease subunit [Arachidicoccus sp.]